MTDKPSIEQNNQSQPFNQTVDGLPKYSIYSDLIRSFMVVLRNFWIVIPVTILGAGLTYVILEQQPKIYESEATVVVYPQINPGDDNILRVIDIMRYDIVGTYVELLRSRSSVDNAVDALESTYDEDVLDDAIIDIRPVENSSVIAVNVRTTDPEAAQALADEIVLQTMRNNATLGQLSEFYPIQILDTASYSSTPVAPQTKLSLVVGLVASLILGIALAFGYESFRMARQEEKLAQKQKSDSKTQ